MAAPVTGARRTAVSERFRRVEGRWLTIAGALLLLDVALTFDNLWPTPAIWWRGRLSIELAVWLLLLTAAARSGRALSRAGVTGMSILFTGLVFGRYAEVTAQALYGREINLYWDLRFIPDVVAMVTRVAPLWLMTVSSAAVGVVVALVFLALRRAVGRVVEGTIRADERRLLIGCGAAALLLFAVERSGVLARDRPDWDPAEPIFTTPVTVTYARQLRFVAQAMSGSPSLAVSPAMQSDLSRVKDADVFLIFIESYGAVSFERPEIAQALARARATFEAAIRDTQRSVVSAYVESPTFGGSSWLAHLSLMSGIEVRDPDTNAKLMAASRDTMARAFARRGFRTVGLMPGMRQSWPEGSFYGFDEIYSAERLDYDGPEFGWFAIPDQFSLAAFDAREVLKTPRQPLFVFFPTLSSHFPFVPIPPYQPDWSRILDRENPYDGDAIVAAYERERDMDWVNFAPGYADAIGYGLETLAGYLRLRHDRDFVLIVLGDHQPPSLVSGERASWNVPVHVIASRQAIVDDLVNRGFQRGIAPGRSSIGRMHTLVPLLLAAFGDS